MKSGLPGKVRPGRGAATRTAASRTAAARPAGGDAARSGVRPGRPVAVALLLLAVAVIAGVSIGPAGLSLPAVGEAVLARLPWHLGAGAAPVDIAIVWQIRLPRVVLGALVGAMLAGGGAAYQGVFRNPLADPYLLGVAAGGGLGATIVIVAGGSAALLPPAAFAGAAGAVALTYLLGAGGPGRAGGRRERHHRLHRAGRGGGGGHAHRGADLPAAAARADPAGGLLLDSRRPVPRHLVRCHADPAVRGRGQRRSCLPTGGCWTCCGSARAKRARSASTSPGCGSPWCWRPPWAPPRRSR